VAIVGQFLQSFKEFSAQPSIRIEQRDPLPRSNPVRSRWVGQVEKSSTSPTLTNRPHPVKRVRRFLVRDKSVGIPIALRILVRDGLRR
jgi:hypothetical protein